VEGGDGVEEAGPPEMFDLAAGVEDGGSVKFSRGLLLEAAEDANDSVMHRKTSGRMSKNTSVPGGSSLLKEFSGRDLDRLAKCHSGLAQLPQLRQNIIDFQVFFRRNSLFVGPSSGRTPM
jgi:hypothetical protein